MRLFSIAAIAALTLGVSLSGAVSASAQSAPTQHKKILGYQDAETGVFHAIPQPAPETTTTTTPTTGKFIVTFDVTVESSFPKGSTIGCGVDITELASNVITTPPVSSSTVAYSETGSSSVAAGAAGSKVTCVVSIPYSWLIPTPPKGAIATNTLVASYTVTAYAPSTTVTLNSFEGLRSSGSAVPIPNTLPKDGATTTATVDVTL